MYYDIICSLGHAGYFLLGNINPLSFFYPSAPAPKLELIIPVDCLMHKKKSYKLLLHFQQWTHYFLFHLCFIYLYIYFTQISVKWQMARYLYMGVST